MIINVLYVLISSKVGMEILEKKIWKDKTWKLEASCLKVSFRNARFRVIMKSVIHLWSGWL